MEDMKILVLAPLPAQVVEALLGAKAPGEITSAVKVISPGGASGEALLSTIGEADIIVGDYTFNVAIDADVVAAANRCKFIQQPSTGYQHIDVDAASKRGIPVSNVAGANAVAVAEHALMVILACLKKLILADEKTRRCEWAQYEMAGYGVFELSEKTLGIIGAGQIGREVALRALPFGPAMIYYDVKRLPSELEKELGLAFSPLDELIAQSDVITIHTPLTPETENLIDANRISGMKPGAILVNLSRGAIVDEDALADALREGKLGGAAVDVFSAEPIRGDNPLLDAPNVILTPHIAGATNESRWRIINMALDNVIRVVEGRKPINVVNGVEPPGE